MEILSLPQILWQALNFILLYFVIAKFIVPPTQKFLKKREEEIQAGLENAEKVKRQLDEAEKMKEEVLASARNEGTAIIAEMRKKSEDLEEKLLNEAKANAEKKVEELVQKAEGDFEKRRQSMNEEVAQLATIIARKALPDSLNSDTQHSLLKSQIEKLKSVKV
jgi:F-type H+-transporting ATPase subunit b